MSTRSRVAIAAIAIAVSFSVPIAIAAVSSDGPETPEQKLEEQVAAQPEPVQDEFREQATETLEQYKAVLRDGKTVEACREELKQDPEAVPCSTIVADYETLQKLEATEGYDK